MIQCKDCEFYETTEQGKRIFKCDPFSNIKEPQCLEKWQLLRLEMLFAAQQNMMNWYEKMAPMQRKIFKYVQREIDDLDQADHWKYEDPDQGPDQGPLL